MLKLIKFKILKLYFEIQNPNYYCEILNEELYVFEYNIYYEDRLIYTTKKDKK